MVVRKLHSSISIATFQVQALIDINQLETHLMVGITQQNFLPGLQMVAYLRVKLQIACIHSKSVRGKVIQVIGFFSNYYGVNIFFGMPIIIKNLSFS